MIRAVAVHPISCGFWVRTAAGQLPLPTSGHAQKMHVESETFLTHFTFFYI